MAPSDLKDILQPTKSPLPNRPNSDICTGKCQYRPCAKLTAPHRLEVCTPRALLQLIQQEEPMTMNGTTIRLCLPRAYICASLFPDRVCTATRKCAETYSMSGRYMRTNIPSIARAGR